MKCPKRSPLTKEDFTKISAPMASLQNRFTIGVCLGALLFPALLILLVCLIIANDLDLRAGESQAIITALVAVFTIQVALYIVYFALKKKPFASKLFSFQIMATVWIVALIPFALSLVRLMQKNADRLYFIVLAGLFTAWISLVIFDTIRMFRKIRAGLYRSETKRRFKLKKSIVIASIVCLLPVMAYTGSALMRSRGAAYIAELWGEDFDLVINMYILLIISLMFGLMIKWVSANFYFCLRFSKENT